MRWKRVQRNNRADRLISGAFHRRIEEVELPPYPAFGQAPVVELRRRRNNAWASVGRVRAANVAFALFFAASFTIVAANIGKPPLFATYLFPQVEEHQLNTKLPQALDKVRNLIAPNFIGG